MGYIPCSVRGRKPPVVMGCRCEAISEVWRWRGGARGHGVSGVVPWLIASAIINGVRRELLEISPQWLGVGMNRVVPDKIMCVGVGLVVIRPDKRIDALLGARRAVFAIRDVGSRGLRPRSQTLVTPLMSANAWLQATSAICSRVGAHTHGKISSRQPAAQEQWSSGIRAYM